MPSRLDAYREDIAELKSQGVTSKADILREVERKHGKRIPSSNFYAYCDTVPGGAYEGESERSEIPEEVRRQVEEVPKLLRSLNAGIERLTTATLENDRDAKQRHEELRKVVGKGGGAKVPLFRASSPGPKLSFGPRFSFRDFRYRHKRKMIVLALIAVGYVAWPTVWPYVSGFSYQRSIAPWLSPHRYAMPGTKFGR